MDRGGEGRGRHTDRRVELTRGSYHDIIKQVTLRLDDALTDRLKAVASARGESVNRFAEAVLSAAVDPDLADSESARLRERLERAGILAHFSPSRAVRPSETELAYARAEAGRGRSVSELVSEGRG